MRSINVYGLKLSVFTLDDVRDFYSGIIDKKGNAVVFGHSFGSIPVMKKFPHLVDVVNSFDLLVCDGTPFSWYCKLFGFPLKQVISIPEITNFTLEYADNQKLRVLLLGAKESINQLATNRLAEKYPNAVFLQGINGYFSATEEADIVSKISSQAPDVLLIGISTPVKEMFAYKYRKDLNASIIIPCGGMIDVYAGITKQSPKIIKKLGLAAPYRILQEPRRLFKLHTWYISEAIFKIVPLTLYNRLFSRNKSFSLVADYIGKTNQPE